MAGSAELRALLAGPVLEVAPRLLGATLRHGTVALRVTEVEAYDGANDAGSHAYRGQTARNAVMFGPAGYLYCYFTYGMHVCCNVVTGGEGTPSAVLLRAGEVTDGIDLARSRRAGASDRDLARGPARLCRALDIALDDNGNDLVTGPITLELGDAAQEVSTGPRVGLRGDPDRPWRFWVTGERTVSAYRPATTRRRRTKSL
ncbi:MAG TPA: DNA-3-methyladenine glycosylase [Nocardioides bacterium]|uniref:DNA-3-methyladenine glycosylase n=1 Tax=uncultured Nocardioides sp. TaxID=198441 RepID=UPI000EEDB151|nr:DNA-3-methyladenine glycosylase [uncultured Nocardioides sp.]HCB06951.1 DNA-3-methyladenine glycosylase [Nocardioides sp.]